MIATNDLKKRIVEISYEHKLSHLGSCLTAVDIVKEIYDLKKDDEKFVLSQGHAGLALYVVLDVSYGLYNAETGKKWSKAIDAETLLNKCGIHPDRKEAMGFVDCSTGSLGHGLPIAVGIALADRTKNVYCLISDGELAEGSMWEALRIAKEQNLTNLKVHANFNGYAGYKGTDTNHLESMIRANGFPVEIHYTNVDYLPFLEGLQGHYHVMNEEEYQFAVNTLR